MAIEHDAISDGERHEPKGISSAPAGSLYTGNGAASGTWERVHGWGQYQDSRRTVGTPTQTLTAGVRTKWICDGSFLTVEKLPSDALAPLWNITTNKVAPIAAFDLYTLRCGFFAENYGGTNPYIEFALDIGAPIGEITWRNVSLNKGGAVVKTSIAFPVFSGATFLANGGEIYLTYQGTGTCDIYANDILITRDQKAYV